MVTAKLRRVFGFVVALTALTASAAGRAEEASLSSTFGKIPLYFEPNLGQAPEGVQFLARGEGYVALVDQGGVSLQLRSGSCGQAERKGPLNREAEPRVPEAGAAEAPCTTEMANLRVEGRSKQARLIPEQKLEGISNYLIGKDSSRWLTHIPQFGSVRVAEVYPGIDMVLRSNGKKLRYDFEVKPGADAGRIRLRLEGAERAELATDRVIHHLKGGRLEQTSLRVFQGTDEIQGASFSVTSDGVIGFEVPRWDGRQTLLIDPTLAWSTFLGGSGPEYARAIAVDSSGSAYVTGEAANPDFPVTLGAYDTGFNGSYDVFVTKLNAAGTALAYSTYLGGSSDDRGYGIAVDGSACAYATGYTASPNFPVTPGAYDTILNGTDVFVAKLNATGTGLVTSTLLGGLGVDVGYGIAVDASGSAHVTGATPGGFPTTPGAYDTSHNGSTDVFVTKLNTTGTGLVYSTFLGGSSGERAHGIAVDASECAYVTGYTDSSNFPTTAGAYDTSYNGSTDVFVAKLDATGTGLVTSTFLGGSSDDHGYGISVDSSGSAYVTGGTDSSDFPTTAGAYDTSYDGSDVFVTKLNPTLTGLVYSTFLGGSNYDIGYGIAVDASGSAHVTGWTRNSTNFPTTAGAYDTSFNGIDDVFVTKLNVMGTGLVYSTFLGGSSSDYGYGIAVDASGSAYVTGYTESSNFPTTAAACDTVIGGDLDAFVTKLSPAGDSLLYSTFLGGTGSWGHEMAFAIAIDGSGSAYVSGFTVNPSFPTTAGAYDTILNGADVFVTKLNPTGTGLVYSTFLGGSEGDYGKGIGVDGSGSAYVTGFTYSLSFPATAGAYDTSLNGIVDAFVTKLNTTGTGLVYSTFLGGSVTDAGYGIAVDASGSAYVTGETSSSDFPATAGAYDASWNGYPDVFVTKLNATGTGLIYSTFLGGSFGDVGYGIAVDASGIAYVTGDTYSLNFPATAGAYDASFNGLVDAFVTKLSATGTGLIYSTFLGGSSEDHGYGIAVDAFGSAYVTGCTPSADFPTTAGAFDTSSNGGDVIVTKLNETGTGLVYSTFLGGFGEDAGHGIAVDTSGSAYVTGATSSADFPTTAGAYDTSINGATDVFMTKLNATGTGLISSTFLGGIGEDAGQGIAVDASGSAYVTGSTRSGDFPGSAGAFQSSPPGPDTAFVTKATFNRPLGITPVESLTLPRGTTTNGLQIATVSHPDTPLANLVVSAMTVPPGITISDIALLPTGATTANVTATMIAACNAAPAGTATLTVSDGIAAPLEGTLAIFTTGSVSTAAVTGGAVLCAGESTTLSVTLTGLAPWTLNWSDGLVQNGLATSPASRMATPAITTTYTITSVRDANGCGTPSGSATVTVNPRPAATVTAGPLAICPGGSGVISALLSGTPPWTVTWSDGFVQSGVSTSPVTRSVSPSPSTTYSITSVTDGGPCTGTGSGSVAVTEGDIVPPAVTPPDPITVTQTQCSPNGSTGTESPALAAFLAAGTATDNCTASPTRLAPQVGGVDAVNATAFPAGTTTVTFRFQDEFANTGTATSTVTVQLWGDLNLSDAVTSTDVFVLANYLVGNITQGSSPFTAPIGLADVNHSGGVSSTDLFILKNFMAGNIACLAPPRQSFFLLAPRVLLESGSGRPRGTEGDQRPRGTQAADSHSPGAMALAD